MPSHKNQGPKTTSFQCFSTTSQLRATLTTNIFGIKHDIDNWRRALIGNYKRSPAAYRTFTNFREQKPKNSTRLFSFTNHLKILYSASLPGFAHRLERTEFNQTLLNGRKSITISGGGRAALNVLQFCIRKWTTFEVFAFSFILGGTLGDSA